MKALPVLFYRDPADSLDEVRRLRAVADRQAERCRRHKRMRIKALVREAMKNGGGNGR